MVGTFDFAIRNSGALESVVSHGLIWSLSENVYGCRALLTFASNLYTFVCSHSKHFEGLQSGKLHRAPLGQYDSLVESLYSALFALWSLQLGGTEKLWKAIWLLCVLQCSVWNFPDQQTVPTPLEPLCKPLNCKLYRIRRFSLWKSKNFWLRLRTIDHLKPIQASCKFSALLELF